MAEFTGLVTFRGNPLTLVGNEVNVGDTAPDFEIASSLAERKRLSDFAGKVRVLNVVPSLDTSVCSTQTQKFDRFAKELGEDVVVLTISMDLPPAQARWAQEHQADHVVLLSDYLDHSFGLAYGVRIKELGVLARSVFVVDRDGKVVYKQIVPETVEEPDYEPVIEAVKKALG
ncbi:MAG: putative thiol peroxidase [Candidatus Poribacteria bacterium]|nr:MAG: putative thiol peroxidase [Candidatus Poribacteria bacterium]